MRGSAFVFVIGLLGVAVTPAGAQGEGHSVKSESSSKPAARMILEMKTGETHLTSNAAPHSGKFTRWFEVEMATMGTRYHFIRNTGGVTAANNNQYLIAFQGKLKLDPRGRYTITAGIFPGSSFTGGWNNSGWGTGRGRSNLYLKQLYFSAQPVKGLELQYGGLYFARGESTETTSYDNDGYFVGERIRLTRPENLFFDEVSVTSGYVGDLRRPSVDERLPRLTHSNYHQFLLARRLGERVRASADYTFESGVDTMREAIRIQVPELRVLDAFLFENYQRVDSRAGYGFGTYGQKRLHRKFSLGGGYAQIDRTALNADRFPQGKRLHLTGLLALSEEVAVSAAVTQAVGSTRPGLPRTRLDLAVSYNLLSTIRKAGLF